MIPSLPITLLLAFLLLFAQQGGLLHGVGHLADYSPARQQQEQHPHPGEVCDECLAYAGIGSAVSSTALPALSFVSSCLPADALPAAFSTAPQLAYRSRAPPLLA